MVTVPVRFASTTVSLVMLAGCASTGERQRLAGPIASASPWVVRVDFEVELESGCSVFVIPEEEDRFVDPVVFELEDAIIPESITEPRD